MLRSELFVVSSVEYVELNRAADIAAATITWTARRREYTDLLQKKREAFWKEKMYDEHSTARQLWRSFDMSIGGRHIPT